jgi:hypothetical protein
MSGGKIKEELRRIRNPRGERGKRWEDEAKKLSQRSE